MKNCLLVLISLFFLTSCTVYTEKQSQAVSQSVYATKDSIDTGRFDLAQEYVNETTKFINPPKKRIQINAVYQKPTNVGDSKQRVVIVPEQYKNDKVVVVNSTDYETLLKDKEAAAQLKRDNEQLTKAKKSFDEERQRQKEMTDKMVIKINEQEKTILKQRLTILWEGITIVALLALIGGYIYIRMNSGFRLF